MKVSVKEKVTFLSKSVPNRTETDYNSFVEEMQTCSKYGDRMTIMDIIDILDSRNLLKNSEFYLEDDMTYELKIKKLLD